MDASQAEAKARVVLLGLGFTEDRIDSPVAELSGGWKTRCNLACALTQYSDVLLLDEPTNFLDMFGIIWLQKYLINLRSTSSRTVVLVSHDRDFIDAVCEEIIILENQSFTYFEGNLTEYEDEMDARDVVPGMNKLYMISR